MSSIPAWDKGWIRYVCSPGEKNGTKEKVFSHSGHLVFEMHFFKEFLELKLKNISALKQLFILTGTEVIGLQQI